MLVSDEAGAGSDAGEGDLGCAWDRQILLLEWGGVRWGVDGGRGGVLEEAGECAASASCWVAETRGTWAV